MCSKVTHHTLNPCYTTLWFIINCNMYCRMMPFFSDIHISQGSVATCLRRGGIFKHEFVANLLPSQQLKKFWKSDNSWWNYGQEFGVLFFLTHGVFLIFSTEAAQYECSYRRTTPLVATLPLVCRAVLLRCVMTRYQCANLVTKTPQFASSYSILSPVGTEFLPFSQPSVLVQPALPMRGRWKCDTWICGTWKCGTMLRGRKMRDTKMRETR